MRSRLRHRADVTSAGMGDELDEIKPLRAVITADCCHHRFHAFDRPICKSFHLKNQN